jgi:fermentation-respiration switch protein FrsA (DUF1100 family)
MWQNHGMKFRREMLLVPVLLFAGCASVFFYPTRDEVWTPAQDNVAYRDVRFDSGDGVSLHGWLLCPKAPDPRGTILFLHGNAENVSTHSRSVLWLVEAGYEVFAFDYRGYGASGGTEPDIPGVHRDAKAAVGKVLSLPGVSADRFVVFGQSLGGAVAVYTVATAPPGERPRALILDSPFSGYRRIVRDKLKDLVITWPIAWPASLFYSDAYSPERWIGKAGPGPVIVIHGTADRVVPYAHGKTLYELAPDPKGFWTVEGGGHTMALRNPEVRAQFLAFLASVLPPGGKGACSP